jgi:hypothetical protein
MLRQPGGGITMTGKLATQAAKDPRVHLVGYGPSASTIGANRAARVAAKEPMGFSERRRDSVVGNIGREELQAKVDRGDPVILLEVLAPQYYRHSHLPEALNLPPGNVGELAPDLLPDKNAEIVLYCWDAA